MVSCRIGAEGACTESPNRCPLWALLLVPVQRAVVRVADLALAGHDAAHAVRGLAGLGQGSLHLAGALGVDDQDHAETHVKRLERLGLVEMRRIAHERRDGRHRPRAQVDLGGAWSAQAALDYMNTNLSQYNEANGNMIELIICNNDNMAEGAISALEAAGYNTGAEGATTIPVFGVDATDAAKELIAAGKMTGTVKQDAEGMAVAIASVVKAAGEGTAMADAVAATAGTNAEMYSIADGIANKLFVAYAAYTK